MLKRYGSKNKQKTFRDNNNNNTTQFGDTMITVFLFLMYHILSSNSVRANVTEKMLFDFKKIKNVENWVESSDTVREVGMSKATLVIQQTQVFQRAVFFTLLNPQPNGAGFAGVAIHSNWDLNNYNSLLLHLRGQGENTDYKIVLRHKNENKDYPAFEQFFTAPKTFETITLPLSDFQPYYRGKPLNNSTLDKAFISSIGLQIYGGVYLPKKQSGVSSLEIDWIKAV